jgi:DNA modification methylase
MTKADGMSKPKKQASPGRPRSGRSRSEILREAKVRYRIRLKEQGKVVVSLPISEEANLILKDGAESSGQSATALMTDLLEQAAQQWSAARTPALFSSPSRSPERSALHSRFAQKLVVNPLLTRKLVSFQASKTAPFYRWLKYKEAFSPELVDYIYDSAQGTSRKPLHVLDPFAGTGTALTRACARGWQATGIELMPVGTHALKARFLADRVNIESFEKALRALARFDWKKTSRSYSFPHVRITQGAFPAKTELEISAFMRFLEEIQDDDVRFLFWFGCLSVLEEVSYTRKDGQYLRWDYRSARKLSKHFDKGEILPFAQAVQERLRTFHEDLFQRNGGMFSTRARVIEGSCLLELPKLAGDQFDLVLTSPPYCNRYDYTRTYALELALCGHGEDDFRRLRQTLLSATVENKSKRETLKGFYTNLGASSRFDLIQSAFDQQAVLHLVLSALRRARDRNELSNSHVPNLVENYFFEMAQVIFELARVLRPGGQALMVNDNVRYHGEEIPVDLILSDFGEQAGLITHKLWVLPRGKGNSSQQMGKWGRVELRKCVYWWRKP